MAFPDQALDVAVELKLGDTWTDITRHVYTREPITITRGRQDEGQQSDPSQCTLTINNRDGRYSPRNPLGEHYGLLGRNTPIRVRVGTGAQDMALQVPDIAGSKASTPDAAAIDITGDLDARVDAAVRWVGDSGGLVGKYVESGNQRSWILWSNGDGKLTLFWSTDGGNLPSAVSTAPVPASSGRLAVRATLDVNNGASGRTVTFYTAPTIAGPWTQLGAPVVQAGTTSVFNSTSPLQVGEVLDRVAGNYYAAEVRSGIAGTVVANPNFAGQAKDTATFTDGAGRTWTVAGDATISDWVTRFYGEVPAWPIHWDASGNNVWVQIEAAGITRRLAQGRKPLKSALYRSLAGAPTSYAAWWPLEDSTGSHFGAPGYPSLAPMRLTGDAAFTGEATGGVAGGLGISQNGRAFGVVPRSPGSTEWVVAFWMDVPLDIATDDNTPIVQWRTPGAPIAFTWDIYTSGALGGRLLMEAANGSNVNLFTVQGALDLRGRGPTQVIVECTQHTGDVAISVSVDGQWDNTMDAAVSGDTVSQVTDIGLNMSTVIGSTQFSGSVSHLIVCTPAQDFDLQERSVAGGGYVGETAGARFLRLTSEEGLTADLVEVAGPDRTEAMGPQQPLTLLELLDECAAADGGVLYEQMDALALRYRPRAADYNTPAALTLDYTTELAAPLEPVDDDQQTRNDVTVERIGGSSARVTLDAGTLSTQPPPDGVGIYNEQVTLNVATDDQLVGLAGWLLHLGTVDEARYPVVRVKLHKHPELIETVVGMDLRSRINLTGLPAWEPPGTVDLLADGYTETIEPLRWTIEFNTVPGSPWRVAVTDDPVLARVETDGALLAGAATSSATTLMVSSPNGAGWTTNPAEAPFDVTVGGEVVTVTAVADGVNDAFARTVSNGWGSAPGGQPWTAYGTAAHYSVASSIGLISVPSRNVADVAGLAQHTDGVDVEATFRSTVAPITGDAIYFYLIGAFDQTASTWYALRAGMFTDGTIKILIEYKAPSGGTTTIANQITVPGVSVAANAWRRARLRVQNGRVDGKVWPDGSAEPEWQLTAFDTSYTGGDVGVQAWLPTANTNTLPVAFQWGDMILHDPQKFTVTRAVNGISKAQAAGAAVRLAQPSTIAL